MRIEDETGHDAGARGPVLARLSGRTVAQLGVADQFVLWAVRQRLQDGAEPSRHLIDGFRLAFGLAGLEAALRAFEELFGHLLATARCPLGVCPLRCACLSRGEECLLRLVAAADGGREEASLAALAGMVVQDEARAAFARRLRPFALHLRQAQLLALREDEVGDAAEPQAATLH